MGACRYGEEGRTGGNPGGVPWRGIQGRPFVVVSVDPTGSADFGPSTPGTQSSGLAEALATGSDVFCARGTYHTSVPIVVNAGQRFMMARGGVIVPDADTDVIQIPPVRPAAGGGPHLVGVHINDAHGNQRSTAGIHFQNAANAIWDVRLDQIRIENCWNAITSDAPPTPTLGANGICRLYAKDVHIETPHNQGLFLQSFWDNVWEDLFLHITQPVTNLTVPNVELHNGAGASGSWFVRTKILGNRIGNLSGSGMLIDNVADFWLQDSFTNLCGGDGYQFSGSVDRLQSNGAKSIGAMNAGFHFLGNATGNVYFFGLQAGLNKSFGIVSSPGDATAKVFWGPVLHANSLGPMNPPQLPGATVFGPAY